ncbi:hypothetical protein C1I89_33590 [Achromobacter pulmonis]|uniref:Uncharacterized protein n=1 Tax=Achromobacter pulmonis TaxID=1389932 RepID=A0A2N8K871_9BURK|nr:hypothetical protein [Achromobacter pulmonis]PND29651.1 hypothetical protein C1I89_33590 [Achromobacter pulmonis]
METIFLILLLASLVALVVGIVSPRRAMPWAKSATRFKALGLYLGIAVICFVGFGVSTDAKKAEPTATTVAAESTPTPAVQPKKLSPAELVAARMPDSQKGFLALMEKAAREYEAAPNELVKSKIAQQRKVDSRPFTPQGKVQNWTGTIEQLATNGDGKGIVVIRSSSTVTFQTWNNALSDLEHKTLIPQSSSLYDTVASLDVGTPVSFSGSLVAEGSATEHGSVTRPEFIVRFDQISPLH